ncbi:hypothetical protein DIPPA_10057 [Diplonema papillatum]|nr:hypothetical protein DIPPA_10057 [Diplonema papillatum]
MLVFEMGASECINITSSPYADGCFADQTMKNLENITKYNFTEEQKQEFSKGHEAAVLLVQTKAPVAELPLLPRRDKPNRHAPGA